MRIIRHCGKERLPGGERLWRKMAREVGFKGTVRVYGYGVKGVPGIEQRRAARTGHERGMTLGDYDWESGEIRVWLPCSCAVSAFDIKAWSIYQQPRGVFAHELGHHRQRVGGRAYKKDATFESVAERFGRMLMRSV